MRRFQFWVLSAYRHGMIDLPLSISVVRLDKQLELPTYAHDADAEVRVLEPISTVGMTEVDIPVLRERVRDLIVAEVAKMSAAA